jgi:phosphatidylglycerophosphatase A
MLGLPWSQHWWLLGMGFVTARVLDIIKPPPARQAQNLFGGAGIVLDDAVSSLYALAVNHALWYMITMGFHL